MSEWFYNKQNSISNFRQLLQERTEKANPRRNLKVEEAKRLAKLEAIVDKLKRGENVQNRQLQTWLSEDEYAQISLSLFVDWGIVKISHQTLKRVFPPQCL